MVRNTIKTKAEALPRHVGIIMDGNGRWAKQRLLPRSVGHKKGMERMLGLIEHAFELGVPQLTVYALSTENLKRPQAELDGLFNLILEHFIPEMEKVKKNGVRVKVLGDISLLPKNVQDVLNKAQSESESGQKHGLNIALAYGARAEIVRAANLAAKSGEPLTEESLANFLYTSGQPDVDLIIRTGKEQRLSNFLLYQAAYAELYFSDKMFPEFSDADFDAALKDFALRTRRFGKTDEQCRSGKENN
jgi:undecaprenyl diphosphate synthase